MTGGNHGAYTGYLTGEARYSSSVMPGLVPGIHVGPPPGSLPARTAMR